VWTGANDYIFFGQGEPPEALVQSVVGNIVSAIETLYSLGAREFIVPGLPNISRSPLIPQSDREGLEQLTLAHNAVLAASLGQLAVALPGASFYRPDTYTLMN